MIITLYSKGYKASIDTLGAELKSYQAPHGKEFLWNSNPYYWKRSSPLLFPLIGNVRDNQTIIQGKQYNIPKHGFVHSMEFYITSQSENSITFSITHNEETLSMYPFQFQLLVQYTLNGNSLNITYHVVNKSSSRMYYNIGAHPGFNCPLEEDESLHDYIIEFSEKETLSSIMYDISNFCFQRNKHYIHMHNESILPLKASLFDHDAVYFPNVKSKSVQLINKKTKKGIQLDYPDFNSLAIWSPIGGNAPFICLEPWNGCAIYDDESDYLDKKEDIQILEPRESTIYNLHITILE